MIGEYSVCTVRDRTAGSRPAIIGAAGKVDLLGNLVGDECCIAGTGGSPVVASWEVRCGLSPPRHGPIGWIRQWIESVNDTLKGQLDLERHGGRTTAGVYARIAQRLLAMAATIWHNWTTAEPVRRSLIAYDH